MDAGALRAELERVEAGLDPARPRASGLRVLAYGEISATLAVPGAMFDGRVAKRMAGFPDDASARAYQALVLHYCTVLRRAGLSVLDTEPLVVPRAGRSPVVYLIQPRAAADRLGNTLLHRVPDPELGRLVTAALEQADRALAARADGLQVAIDAQLSNFVFGDQGPTLFDVGTPFLRQDGRDLLDMRVMLAAVPPGVRAIYLRRRIGERYIDDYFDRRLVAVDLLGNFAKEAAEHRIATGLAAANEWLGESPAITSAEVAEYYRRDAATLRLFLRVRRADRWLRTVVLRRSYDFVLPGQVRR